MRVNSTPPKICKTSTWRMVTKCTELKMISTWSSRFQQASTQEKKVPTPSNTKTTKIKLSARGSPISTCAPVKSVAKLHSERLTCSRCTQAFTWVHFNHLLRPKISSKKALHISWMSPAKNTPSAKSTSSTSTSRAKTKLERTRTSISGSPPVSLTRASKMEQCWSTQCRGRAELQLLSWHISSTRRRWSWRMALGCSENTLTRSSQMKASCNS